GARISYRLAVARTLMLSAPSRSAIEPVFYKGLYDAWISECRGVAERAEGIFSDLSEHAAHNLSGSRLGQYRGRVQQVPLCDGPNLCPNGVAYGLLEGIVRRHAFHESDIGVNTLALDVVRVSDHRSLGDVRVGDKGAFYFRCTETMPGDVQYVIDTAGDPVVAV